MVLGPISSHLHAGSCYCRLLKYHRQLQGVHSDFPHKSTLGSTQQETVLCACWYCGSSTAFPFGWNFFVTKIQWRPRLRGAVDPHAEGGTPWFSAWLFSVGWTSLATLSISLLELFLFFFLSFLNIPDSLWDPWTSVCSAYLLVYIKILVLSQMGKAWTSISHRSTLTLNYRWW